MKNIAEQFRKDVEANFKELEKKYGIRLRLGTIRYDFHSFTATVSADVRDEKLKPAEGLTMVDLHVGQKVGIDHPKNKGQVFEIIKKNRTKVQMKDSRTGQMWTCPPEMLFRIN
jgi:hypothetical protein